MMAHTEGQEATSNCELLKRLSSFFGIARYRDRAIKTARRFILRIYFQLRFLLVVCVLVFATVGLLMTTAVEATTVKDFIHSMSSSEKSDMIAKYVDRIVSDIKTTDPDLAKKIGDYFYQDIPDKKSFIGVHDLEVEMRRQLRMVMDHQKKLTEIDEVEVIIKKNIEKNLNITLTEVNGKFAATTGAPADKDVAASPATQPDSQLNTQPASQPAVSGK